MIRALSLYVMFGLWSLFGFYYPIVWFVLSHNHSEHHFIPPHPLAVTIFGWVCLIMALREAILLMRSDQDLSWQRVGGDPYL